MRHGETQNYGFNLILKDYAKFPRFLPLPCHIEHGWTSLPNALVSDLNTTKPLMMVFSKRRLEAWKKESTIPVAVMGSPFVHYKNDHKIVRDKDAKGTIVYPSHSTFDLEAQFDQKAFCAKLHALPAEFKPITVCLFWLDYIEESADLYRQEGFSVVTTGPKLSNSLSFPKNFYTHLARHKYAASNDVGSYTFYAVEFGTPFFLVGEPSVVINLGMKDVNIGAEGHFDDTEISRATHHLFSTGPVTTISPEQKELVEAEMGVHDCLSSSEMNKLFWQYFKEHKMAKKVLPYLFFSSLWTLMLNGPWGRWAMAYKRKQSHKK